jgi:hypothetical protein
VGLDLRNAFEIRFALNLGCRSNTGEGIAFVMQTDARQLNTLGCAGNGMGFGSGNCSPISPSLAIEFDGKFTPFGQKDLHAPHIALVQNGNMAAPLLGPIKAYTNQRNLTDCEYHQFRITWKPSKQELQVFVDERLRMTYNGNLSSRFFNGRQEVFFGFTASSAEQTAMQMVCIQSITMELDEEFNRRRAFDESVGIFTDPLREKLTIDIKLEQEQYLELQLFDNSGKLIYEIPPHLVRNNQYFVNLPGLPSGVYFITVTNGLQRVSRKIVHVGNMRA